MNARIDENNWVRCGKCSHKLMKIVGAGICNSAPIVEVKCHSCKELNILVIGGRNEKK